VAPCCGEDGCLGDGSLADGDHGIAGRALVRLLKDKVLELWGASLSVGLFSSADSSVKINPVSKNQTVLTLAASYLLVVRHLRRSG